MTIGPKLIQKLNAIDIQATLGLQIFLQKFDVLITIQKMLQYSGQNSISTITRR